MPRSTQKWREAIIASKAAHSLVYQLRVVLLAECTLYCFALQGSWLGSWLHVAQHGSLQTPLPSHIGFVQAYEC